MSEKAVLIIGAGPAGLTAAYELIERTDKIPLVTEKLGIPGGLSRTSNYKGNRIDIGGHRFFSKSNRVLNWWLNFLPIADQERETEVNIRYQNQEKSFQNSYRGNTNSNDVMLVRNRSSRIYFLGKLFKYPITLDFSTLSKLGLFRSMKIVFSYLTRQLIPIRPEKTLKDFMTNRFGNELYETFFEDYTRKVWGVNPDKIPPEWGRQRIKGVSISKIIMNAIRRKSSSDVRQKNVETSLIEKFLYPKFGPGQLWEKVTSKVEQGGGKVLFNHEVKKLKLRAGRVEEVVARNLVSNEELVVAVDTVISSMPVRDLINAIDGPVPDNIRSIANGLEYREFISIGLLVKSMKLCDNAEGRVRDNWIYIQDKNVSLGRLQIFNNWSPYMVDNPNYTWLGLEYFCQEGDELWSMSDQDLLALGEKELIDIGVIEPKVVLDGTVIKVEKAYPGYFGTYNRFDELKGFLNEIENLFLVGRNGMHRYNNQDHSMLTAMEAVEKIVKDDKDKNSIWNINTEDKYHEESQ